MEMMIAKRDRAYGITKGKSYVCYAYACDVNGSDVLVENDDGVKMWIRSDLFESKELHNAKRIAEEVAELAERERIRDIVAEQVRNSCLPGGEIFNHVKGVGGSGWQIKKTSDAIIQSINYEPNEYIKVLEQLREALQVPEGENIVTHAKVVRALADALIGLQK
ncbi:putative GntR-family transcriptional regulator [Salmonella phage Sephi301i]